MRQVFLKQFRDAAEGTRACYQSVVEAPITVKRVSLRPSLRDWDLTIHHLDSHPIEQEIGIGSQRAAMAFDGELDMVVETGVEIGRVAAPPGAPGVRAAGPDRRPLRPGRRRIHPRCRKGDRRRGPGPRPAEVVVSPAQPAPDRGAGIGGEACESPTGASSEAP